MVSRVNIVAVGKIKDRNIDSLIAEFLKRLTPFIKMNIKEIKDEGITKESLKISEIFSEIKDSCFILDAKGKQYTSEEFSAFLHKMDDVTFIIGGPDGIDENVKKNAKLISISSMTFTHEMARMFLIEQIYRAKMIEKGRPYHK